MSDNQIVIDLNQIDGLAKEGGKLIFKKQAEDAILRLLQMKDFLEEKLEEIKLSIIKSGRYLDPKFKGVVGEHVKAMYRSYGKKYTYTGDPERIPPDVLPYVKITVRVEVDSKKVDKYLKDTGNIPGMIQLNEREPILSLTKIKKDEEVEPVVLAKPQEQLAPIQEDIPF